MTSSVGELGSNPSIKGREIWVREWFVHATPVPGYLPEGAINSYPNNSIIRANRMIIGPFPTPIMAAEFVAEKRPIGKWLAVAILSRRTKEKYPK